MIGRHLRTYVWNDCMRRPNCILFLFLTCLVSVNLVSAQEVILTPTIIEFSSTVTAVRLPEIEMGGVETTLSWTVIEMGDEYALNIQTYRERAWETVVLSDEPLPASGSARYTITHPGTFAPPTYRLIVTDGDGGIVDERHLVIAYETPPALARFTAAATPTFDTTQGLPRVGIVETDPPALDESVRAQSTVQFMVRYAITNRVSSSDLVFEQLLSDESAVNIEPPREQRWIASQGEVVVSAAVTPDTSAIRIRVRVVDLITGVNLDSVTLIVPVGAVDAALPTATIAPFTPAVVTVTPERAVPSGGSLPNAPTLPAPPTLTANTTPTVQTALAPTIVTFSAAPATVSAGGVTRLSWEVNGAASIEIQEISDAGTFGLLYIQLPAQGSIQVTLPADARVVRYTLTARAAAGAAVTANVIVSVS
jgi:hypothetical protein